jgi:hypothetical protein
VRGGIQREERWKKCAIKSALLQIDDIMNIKKIGYLASYNTIFVVI